MARYDLIAFDLDGTVFAQPQTQVVNPRVVSAFKTAHDQGVQVAVASGRPTGMLGPSLTDAPWVDWHITVNGASVTRASDGKVVSARMMPLEQVRQIVACVRSIGQGAGEGGWSLFAPGHSCFESSLNSSFSKRFSVEEGRESFSFVESTMAQGGKIEEMDHIDTVLDLLETDVFKVGCMFDTVELTEEAKRVLNERFEGLEMACVGPTELEITKAGVNKGSALHILCESLGIDETRAVAFGDSGNDATFAQSSCTFVAMGNATPEIKQIADDVCPSVREDGVAVWLEEHLGL